MVQLSISNSMIACPVVDDDTNVTSTVGIDISGTNTSDESDQSILFAIPYIPEPETTEPFEPFVYIAPTIYISTDDTEIGKKYV